MQSNTVKKWNLEILAHEFSFEVIFHKKKNKKKKRQKVTNVLGV